MPSCFVEAATDSAARLPLGKERRARMTVCAETDEVLRSLQANAGIGARDDDDVAGKRPCREWQLDTNLRANVGYCVDEGAPSLGSGPGSWWRHPLCCSFLSSVTDDFVSVLGPAAHERWKFASRASIRLPKPQGR